MLGLLAITGLLYAPVARYPFLHWDDGIYVSERAALQRIAAGNRGAWRALLSPREALAGRSWEYLPLRDLSYGLDAWRAGLEPHAFHLTNLGLHLSAVLLLFGLARALGTGAGPALAAAALFALHPLAVEPTAWISARKDLLYGSCTLLALLALLHLRKREGLAAAGARATFLLATLAALGSKAPAIVVPLLAAVLVWRCFPAPQQRRERWPLLGLGALAAGWALLSLEIGRRSGIISSGGAAGLGERIGSVLAAPAEALARLAAPVALSPSYRDAPGTVWAQPATWIGLTLTTALIARIALTLRRRTLAAPVAAFPLSLCAWLALLPTAGIVRVAQPRADRFLYLPLALAALTLGALMHAAAPRVRRALLVAAALAAALCAAQTQRYLEVWRNDLTLWRHVVEADPDHPLANGQLAALAIEQGQLQLAKRLLDRALTHGPRLAPSWSNLGRWWQIQAGASTPRSGEAARQYQLAQAERAFARAIALDPRYAPPYLELANLAEQRGDRRLAEGWLRRALTLPRCPALARQRLDRLEALRAAAPPLSRQPGR
ncbi:MAG: hypothetical protein IPL40_16230 [Proteobacteria bacterium]|nr:hypothetical protein [Pseudomonadota bacterium]